MKLVPVYASQDAMQIRFLAGLLKTNGIDAVVTGEALSTLFGYLPGSSSQVCVREEDEEQAKPIVAQFLSRSPPMPTPDAKPWTCPNCGEVIEAQFTDCWKCQTPRPQLESEAAPAPPPRRPPDPYIPLDLPCVTCGYNLRGLPAQRVCPECGRAAYVSLFAMLRSTSPENDAAIEQVLQPCLASIEVQVGYPIDAIMFVLHAWPRARASLPELGIEPAADAVFEVLRDQAADFVGHSLAAQRTLERWNLATPQGVQGLLKRLREHQLLDPR